jgi:hypothetical protein
METSVSQVETFERCPSWWAYGHVHGIWKERNKTAEDGSDVHEYISNYSKYGQKPDTTPNGCVAKLLIDADLVPSLDDAPSIEEKEKLVYDGHTFSLAIDAVWEAPAGLMLNDYKSVKTFRFMKKASALRSDLQAAVYTLHVLAKHPEYTEALLRWIYVQRPEPGKAPGENAIRVTETAMDEDDARAVLRTKRQSLTNMANIKAKKLPMADVVRNEKSCAAMGGCPYRGECFPGKFDQQTGKPIEPR